MKAIGESKSKQEEDRIITEEVGFVWGWVVGCVVRLGLVTRAWWCFRCLPTDQLTDRIVPRCIGTPTSQATALKQHDTGEHTHTHTHAHTYTHMHTPRNR